MVNWNSASMKQVDVLPSKNQALHVHLKPLLITTIQCSVTSQATHVSRLITKGHIATHTNLFILGLYSSTLVIKLFTKLF